MAFDLRRLLGLDHPQSRPQQRPSAPVNIPLQPQHGQPEDAGFVPGQQLPVRQNADVAHFQGQPDLQGGQYNPGFTPLQNSGFGPSVQQPTQTYWQNTDQRRRNMINPQVDDSGYNYL